MGGAMGKIGNVFSGNGDEIGDSGFSVGDMKDMGYDKGQIADMGATKPTTGTKIARSLIKGAGNGLAGGLEAQGRPQGQPSPAAPPIVPPAPPQLGPMAGGDQSYLDKLRKPSTVQPGFYGY